MGLYGQYTPPGAEVFLLLFYTPGRGVGSRLGGGLHAANGGFGFVSLI